MAGTQHQLMTFAMQSLSPSSFFNVSYTPCLQAFPKTPLSQSFRAFPGRPTSMGFVLLHFLFFTAAIQKFILLSHYVQSVTPLDPMDGINISRWTFCRHSTLRLLLLVHHCFLNRRIPHAARLAEMDDAGLFVFSLPVLKQHCSSRHLNLQRRSGAMFEFGHPSPPQIPALSK